ncbi:MAG: SH3 domain-containing protein [Pseudomonadota bacterium]
MLRLSLFVISVLLLCSWTSASWAQGRGVVVGKTVSVYEQPDGKSEVLIKLKKGSKVTVLAEREGWVQLKVSLPKGFTFTGWGDRRLFKYTLPKAATAKQRKTMPGTSAAGSAAPARRVVPPPRTQAPLQPVPLTVVTPQPTPAPVFREPQPTASFTEEGGFGGISDRLSLTVGVGYSLYGYRINTAGAAPAKVFSYNLQGFGFHAGAKYWIWQDSTGKMRTGPDVQYEFGLYNLTKLQVTTGTETLNVTSDNSTHDIVFRVPFEYRFKPARQASKVGAYLGYEYFRFSANDAKDNNGNEINLFVGQTTQSVLGGAYGTFMFPDNFLGLTAGSDLLFLNFVKERPSGASGTDPSGNLGFTPYASFFWTPAEKHQLDVGYKLRWQNFSFKGAGSRIIANNVTDGTVSTRVHDIFLKYTALF